MDKLEYNKRLLDIEKKFEEDKKSLAREFAYANNNLMAGTFVRDLTTTIEIDRLIIYLAGYQSYPEMVYSGPELTKKLVPRKDGRIGRVHQSSVCPFVLKVVIDVKGEFKSAKIDGIKIDKNKLYRLMYPSFNFDKSYLENLRAFGLNSVNFSLTIINENDKNQIQF